MARKSKKSGCTAAAALIVIAFGGLHQQTALAQTINYDQGRYQNQLLDLAGILGKLHHLRGSCVSGEHQLWRDNMMELVRLENPPPERKNDMVAGFNTAYETAKRQYLSCNRAASRAAMTLAGDGERISDVLAGNVSR